MQRLYAFVSIAVLTVTGASRTWADPCGMVPPTFPSVPPHILAEADPIKRIGVKKTYVFFKDGIETMTTHPRLTREALVEANLSCLGRLADLVTGQLMRGGNNRLFLKILPVYRDLVAAKA